MTATALDPGESQPEDEDLIDRLMDGLLSLPSAVRVRRHRAATGDRPETEAEGAAPAAAGHVAPGRAAVDIGSGAGPARREAADGRVLAITTALQARDGEIEVFVVEADPDGPGLSRLDREAVTTLRDQAALALSLRSARAAARLDAVTGCLNHGAMQAELEDEIARAGRLSGRLACVMIDLDDFKSVNERHGHPAGDAVLRAVSTALRGECREYDVCCRYGGDEFLIILPDAGTREALQSAERLRAAVGEVRVEVEGATLTPAVTAGVTEWRTGEPAAVLLERVDRALLYGKRSGKGRIGRA